MIWRLVAILAVIFSLYASMYSFYSTGEIASQNFDSDKDLLFLIMGLIYFILFIGALIAAVII